MKKLLGIVVLGLLWCNTSFADARALLFDCQKDEFLGIKIPESEKVEFIRLEIDSIYNTISFLIKPERKDLETVKANMIYVNDTLLRFELKGIENSVFQLDYGKSDKFTVYIIYPDRSVVTTCSRYIY